VALCGRQPAGTDWRPVRLTSFSKDLGRFGGALESACLHVRSIACEQEWETTASHVQLICLAACPLGFFFSHSAVNFPVPTTPVSLFERSLQSGYIRWKICIFALYEHDLELSWLHHFWDEDLRRFLLRDL